MVDGFLEGGFDDGNPNTNPIGCLFGGAVVLSYSRAHSQGVNQSPYHRVIFSLCSFYFSFFSRAGSLGKLDLKLSDHSPTNFAPLSIDMRYILALAYLCCGIG